MGFYRKYNTIIRTIDNFIKLYKISKKSKSKKKDDKKWELYIWLISTVRIPISDLKELRKLAKDLIWMSNGKWNLSNLNLKQEKGLP